MAKGHSKRKHSEFAASAAHRWLNCPASVAMARTAPPQVESAYAKEGTDAHECLEFIVKRFKNLKAAKEVALKKWPVDMVDYAIQSAKQIFQLRPSPSAKLLVETRVVLKQIGPGLFGTLDYAWVEDWGKLVIIDYKYGAGVAVAPMDDEGEPNPQLMYYAAGIAHKFNYDFDAVELVVIQPRVWQNVDDAVSVAEVPIKAIREFEGKVRKAITLAKKPDAPIRAGEHCRWCPSIATCPENSKNALAEAQIVFDVDDGITAMPEALALTPETLQSILPACDKLERWIKAVRDHAYRLAENGETIPGYKLVAKRASRVWTPEAEDAAWDKFGINAYETERRFLSPAQLEKKMQTLRKGAEAKQFTAEFTASVSSGFNLVPANDKRPEVETAVVFDTEG